MRNLIDVGNDIINRVDWRNDTSDNVYIIMQDIFESYDLYEFTIDDLKLYFNDTDIAEIMQCYNIYCVMSMI